MRNNLSRALSVSHVALSVALAAGATFATSAVDAQSRGDKPSAAIPGGKPAFHGGGHGNWNGGRHGGWRGGGHDGWRGSGHGRWHGGHNRHHWHGWHGWHGGRYYYPGWALGLGVGVGLTYPWWGWSYPGPYVVYERVYDAPVGVVVDRDVPSASPAPAYRWYCPSPPGFHPDVRECGAGWMKVLPPEGGPSSAPPSSAPPSTAPRSSTPLEEGPPVSRIAPGTTGSAASPGRIAATSMVPPAPLARGSPVPGDSLAHNATP